MWEKVTETLKSMYDSLVRTYTPMVAGVVLGWIATLLPVVPAEIESGLVLLLGLLFQVVWYFIARAIEVVKGKTSPLLTLGLTKSEPVYGTVVAESPSGDVKLVNTEAITTTPPAG